VPFYFGGTSLLIIVVVTMDFMAQVQAYIMTHQYERPAQEGRVQGIGISDGSGHEFGARGTGTVPI